MATPLTESPTWLEQGDASCPAKLPNTGASSVEQRPDPAETWRSQETASRALCVRASQATRQPQPWRPAETEGAEGARSRRVMAFFVGRFGPVAPRQRSGCPGAVEEALPRHVEVVFRRFFYSPTVGAPVGRATPTGEATRPARRPDRPWRGRRRRSSRHPPARARRPGRTGIAGRRLWAGPRRSGRERSSAPTSVESSVPPWRGEDVTDRVVSQLPHRRALH